MMISSQALPPEKLHIRVGLVVTICSTLISLACSLVVTTIQIGKYEERVDSFEKRITYLENRLSDQVNHREFEVSINDIKDRLVRIERKLDEGK